MRTGLMVGSIIVVAAAALLLPRDGLAQWSGSIQTFTNDVNGEEVAPLPVAPAVPASATAMVAGVVSGSAAAPSPTDPFTIKGLVAAVSGSTGFDRDGALDSAARAGLARVLAALPMDEAKARKTAKTVGDPQRFVSSYIIVKEALVPAYSLTVDLTFNEQMLRANFGGVKTVAVSSSSSVSSLLTGGASGTIAGGGAAVALASPTLIVAAAKHTFVVRLTDGDPGAQDRVYKKLREPAGASIRYRVATSEGAEWDVTTPLDQPALEADMRPLNATVVSPLPPSQAPLPGEGGTAVSSSLLNPAGIY